MSKRKASTYNLDITILKSFFVFIMHNSFFFCLYNAPSKIDRVNFDFKYLKLALQNGKIFVNFAWVLKLILSTSLSKMNLLQLPHLYQLRNQSSKSRFFWAETVPDRHVASQKLKCASVTFPQCSGKFSVVFMVWLLCVFFDLKTTK